MPTREEATRLFEQRRDAWLREDLGAYLALWAEDMTFQSPVHAEPLRGRAAFADLVRQAFAFRARSPSTSRTSRSRAMWCSPSGASRSSGAPAGGVSSGGG